MWNDISRAICDFVYPVQQLGIPYAIGGSVSSSLNGVFRTTNDIDIIIGQSFWQNEAALDLLKEKFLIDQFAVLEHLRACRSYNIFHEATALKIDLFPANSEFNQSELQRAIFVQPPSSPCPFKILSVEDTVLAKLCWLKKSQSERQYGDIIGVLRTNIGQVDLNYLRNWADKLEISKLLDEVSARANSN